MKRVEEKQKGANHFSSIHAPVVGIAQFFSDLSNPLRYNPGFGTNFPFLFRFRACLNRGEGYAPGLIEGRTSRPWDLVVPASPNYDPS